MHPHVHSLGQALLRMCWSVQRPSQMLHLLESGGFHFEELRATSGTLPPIYFLFHLFHVSDGHFIDGQRPHQLWKKTKLLTPKLAFLRKTTCLDWCQTLIHLGNNFLCSVGVLELMCLLSPQALDRGLWHGWDNITTHTGLGAVSIRKTVLPGMAIPMLKIRRPNGRLIFNMEITIRR